MSATINRGILTAPQPRQRVRYAGRRQSPPVMTVPLWKAILVTVGLCMMCSSFAYSVRPDPIVVTKVKQVSVDHPVPACKPLFSGKQITHYRQVVDQLAVAVPASALKPWGK
jgi:hypothetical protein